MHLLLSWLVLAVAFLVTARLVSGIRIARFRDAIVASAVFGVLDLLLSKLLFLLIVVGTLGLGLVLAFVTHWVVTAVLIKLTAKISDRISVDSFGAAMAGAFVLTVVSTVGRVVLAAA